MNRRNFLRSLAGLALTPLFPWAKLGNAEPVVVFDGDGVSVFVPRGYTLDISDDGLGFIGPGLPYRWVNLPPWERINRIVVAGRIYGDATGRAPIGSLTMLPGSSAGFAHKQETTIDAPKDRYCQVPCRMVTADEVARNTGGRWGYYTEFKLEPVGVDYDGTIKPIDQLS